MVKARHEQRLSIQQERILLERTSENHAAILPGSSARTPGYVFLICLGSKCTHSTNLK